MGDTFYLKAGDTAPMLTATLTDAEEKPIDLTGSDVAFHLLEPRGGATVLDTPASIPSPDDGTVAYEWADTDTDESGRYRAEFRVTYPDGTVETFPNVGYHTVLISD
jgi:hypothetical protein